MSNYGWVPRSADESDDYLERLALLVSRRPLMEMVEIASTLQAFVEEATLRAAPPPPIDDELVVGGHANQRGDWMIDPFPDSFAGPWTDFEALEDAMNAPGKAVAIPDALIGYSPTTPTPTARAFHIKGCNIGRAEPWLIKLREALGGHVRVTAPKHFHGISTNGTAGVTPLEAIEWMGYQFIAFQKTAFSSRNALAAAFRGQGYVRPDGVTIPLEAYKAWLRLLPVRNLRIPIIKERKRIRLPLGENLGGHRYAEGLMGLYIRTPRSSVVFHTFAIPAPGVIPPTHTARLSTLPTWFQTAPEYLDTHPFPIFKRYGYATLTEMIEGLDWRFNVDTAADPPTIDCIGGRFEYELLVPMATPGPGGTFAPTRAPLIYNHIPESGPPITTSAFDETSPYYYATMP